MPRKVIKPASARYDRLLRGKPWMGGDSFDDLLGNFNVGSLDIHRADAKLFISENAIK